MVADHLPRLPVAEQDDGECELPINDSFQDEHLLALATSNGRFADVVNYLVCGILPLDMNSSHKKSFFAQVKSFF